MRPLDFSSYSHSRPKVAVIGAGIAGNAAAWGLSRFADVTQFEKNGYFGGHSNTVDMQLDGKTVPVDTGFIVFNELNYPNLTRLFDYLNVDTHASDMSFAVSMDDGRFEYSGSGLGGVFAQKTNLFRPSFLRMLWDLKHFYQNATSLKERENIENKSLGDVLRELKYSSKFIDGHILPMAAAIWSAPCEQILAFPAASFIRFFDNHGLFRFKGRPEWRTVIGGSRAYVQKLLADTPAQRHTHSDVCAVQRLDDGGVRLFLNDGSSQCFDQVVLACHGDEAHKLLINPTAQESRILSAFRYSENRTYLHRDTSLMPKRRRAWASWNYVGPSKMPDGACVPVTYWMNRLQKLDTDQDVFITLNPMQHPREELIERDILYSHPIFDQAAYDAQKELHKIQGQGGLWYAGSYFGYGFHEDALTSGLNAARAMGATLPWDVPAYQVAAE